MFCRCFSYQKKTVSLLEDPLHLNWMNRNLSCNNNKNKMCFNTKFKYSFTRLLKEKEVVIYSKYHKINSCCSKKRNSLQFVSSSRSFKTSAIPSNSSSAENKLTRNVILELSDILSRDPKFVKDIVPFLGKKSMTELSAAVAAIQKKQNIQAVVGSPAINDLKLVGLRSAIPFIGFGFVDNFFLILAGDYIDLTFGVSLGISTMAAAAIGNIFSDVAGLGLGGIVEDFSRKLGIPEPKLTKPQSALKIVKVVHYIGCALGVVIGCILGMCPLLFIDTKEDQLEQQANKTLQQQLEQEEELEEEELVEEEEKLQTTNNQPTKKQRKDDTSKEDKIKKIDQSKKKDTSQKDNKIDKKDALERKMTKEDSLDRKNKERDTTYKEK